MAEEPLDLVGQLWLWRYLLWRLLPVGTLLEAGAKKGNAMAWLRVRLDKGMFSDEFAVTYPAAANFQKSVFVPRTYVRQGGEHQGEVEVNVVEKDGQRFAVLPTARRDIVRVEDADLHP